MHDICKGALVGLSAAASCGVAMVISLATGLETRSPLLGLEVNATVGAATPVLFGAGLPIGAAFGMLLVSLAVPGLGPIRRRGEFMLVAVLCVLLCVPFWPDLARCGIPIALVHGLALARWTAPRDHLPRAVAR